MRKYISLLALPILLLSGCNRANEQHQIPNVVVNEYMFTTEPAFNDISYVGGWTYISGGSKGIILFRAGQNEIKAYDRHTPFNPREACAIVSVLKNNVLAEDSCSGTTYSLYDGFPQEGPGELPLQQYRAEITGNELRVYN